MPLTIKVRKNGAIVILEMTGKLTSGEPVLLLRESIRAQLAEGARHFELDIREVSTIDSSGLGELVSTYTSIRAKEGEVKLTGLNSRSKDLLEMTRLLTLFDGSRIESEQRRRVPLWTIAIWAAIILSSLLLYWVANGGQGK